MKKLQNNFTTPEQSKRLLELGMPENTADCFYYEWAWFPYFKHYGKQINVINWNDFNEENRLREVKVFPCWSVGRLIEIMLLCHISNYTGIMFDKPLYEASNCTNIDWCIIVLETSIECGHIDFSKLED